MTGLVFLLLEIGGLFALGHGLVRSLVDLVGALIGGGVCLLVAAKVERPEPALAAVVGVPLGISLAEYVTGFRAVILHVDLAADDGPLALAAIGTLAVGFVMVVAAFLEGISGPWRKSGDFSGRVIAMAAAVALSPVVFYALGLRWS